MQDYYRSAGAIGPGGLTSEYFDRALLRTAPTKFAVTILPATKNEEDFNHGFRITPISRHLSSSSSSSSSSTSLTEYEIWRRWEDCLWFQDKLEIDYKAAARQKRTRLLRGKGVKKNGMYLQDMASSWDSLPPGPAPASVAQDVHEIVPRLTKTSTLFGISQATLKKREKELEAFMEALFCSDVPTLLMDVLADPSIAAFFGCWKNDPAAEQKAMKRERSSQKVLPPPAQSATLAHFKSSLSSSSQSSSSISSGSASNLSDNFPITYEPEPIHLHENPPSSSPRSAIHGTRRSRFLSLQSPTEKKGTRIGSHPLPQVQEDEIEESRDKVPPQLHILQSRMSPGGSNQAARYSQTINKFPLSSSQPATTVSIKASYNGCIIIIRVLPDLPFAEVRQRIYNKLVDQQGVALPSSYMMTAGSSVVASQADWLELVSCNSKITLRIAHSASLD